MPTAVHLSDSSVGMQRRLEEAYAPVIQVLKYLVNPSLQEGAGAVLAQQGGLPAEAANQAKAGILNVSNPHCVDFGTNLCLERGCTLLQLCVGFDMPHKQCYSQAAFAGVTVKCDP